jgi:hypothetical protein
MLHERASLACGQATPPNVGCVKVRLRFWLPTPHDLVQVVKADQRPMTQSVEHGAALQLRVSV